MALQPPKLLYYSLMEQIVKQIEDNELQPGGMIMSERELMDAYGMSRTTVRKALDNLVSEGYLRRVQGKGTFVAEKKFEQGLIKLTSCTEEIRNLGMTPSSRVLSAEVTLPRPSVAQRLGIPETEKIFRLERVLYADEDPVNVTVSHLLYRNIQGIERFDFSRCSMYRVLDEEYGINMHRAIRTLEPVFAGETDAALLRVSPDLPTLLFKGLVFATSDAARTEFAQEYFVSKYRCDKYKFYLEQYR